MTYIVTEEAESFTAFGTECQMVDSCCRTSRETLDKIVHRQMISLWSVLMSVDVRRILIVKTVVRFQDTMAFSENVAIKSVLVDIRRL